MNERELLKRIGALETKVSDLYRRMGETEIEIEGGPSGEEDPDVIALVQAGKQIEAIKLQRAKTGQDLSEAKDVVDRISRTYRPAG